MAKKKHKKQASIYWKPTPKPTLNFNKKASMSWQDSEPRISGGT